MRLIIQPSYEFVSKWTANYVATKIKEFNPNSKKLFVLRLQQVPPLLECIES